MTLTRNAYAYLYLTTVRGSATLNGISVYVYVANNTIRVNLTCLDNAQTDVIPPNTVEGTTTCPAT